MYWQRKFVHFISIPDTQLKFALDVPTICMVLLLHAKKVKWQDFSLFMLIYLSVRLHIHGFAIIRQGEPSVKQCRKSNISLTFPEFSFVCSYGPEDKCSCWWHYKNYMIYVVLYNFYILYMYVVYYITYISSMHVVQAGIQLQEAIHIIEKSRVRDEVYS